MDHQNVSDRFELEQAHAYLDELGVDRVASETLMMLSLKGRIENLMQRVERDDLEPA